MNCSKPKNGECPVCGRMAPKFTPKLSDYYHTGACLPPKSPAGVKIGDARMVNLVLRSADYDDLPKSREVSCTYCRVKYEQDAEHEGGTV